MNNETNSPLSFSSSFISKLTLFMLGIGCLGLFFSGELLNFVSAGIQKEFFIPPFLFKVLLLLFGIAFLLMIFSRIKIDQHGIGTSFLLSFIEPIAWEDIEKIKIEQILVKRQTVLQIHISLKKGRYAQRRLFWFLRQPIDKWTFSWPLQLKSRRLTMAQAIEKFAPPTVLLKQTGNKNK